MGVVYLAVQRSGDFKKLHAIKRPHSYFMADKNFVAMLLDEARISGLIQHPNVVGVSEFGIDEEGPYLVMDYVESVTVSALISELHEKEEHAPLQLALRIAIDIASGLHAAHELTDDNERPLGLVHRDVSPQNILVDFSGRAYLTDFGIAKALGARNVSRAGFAKGKLAYMAPEQIRNQPVDRRTDLYALGVVLYELLAGDRLYAGLNDSEIIDRLLHGSPADIGEYREDISPQLTSLLFDLMTRDINQRPENAAVVCSELESILAEDIVKNGNQSWAVYLERRFGERRQKRTTAFEHALTRWKETSDAALESEEKTEINLPAKSTAFASRQPSRQRHIWLSIGFLSILVALLATSYSEKGIESAAPPKIENATVTPKSEFSPLVPSSTSTQANQAGPDPVAVRAKPKDATQTPPPTGVPHPKYQSRPPRQRNSPGVRTRKEKKAKRRKDVVADTPPRPLWGW